MVRKRAALAGKSSTRTSVKFSLNLSAEENRLLLLLRNKAEAQLLESSVDPYSIDMSHILRAGLHSLKLKSGKQIVELVEELDDKRIRRKAG
jgi:hypothetical protein